MGLLDGLISAAPNLLEGYSQGNLQGLLQKVALQQQDKQNAFQQQGLDLQKRGQDLSREQQREELAARSAASLDAILLDPNQAARLRSVKRADGKTFYDSVVEARQYFTNYDPTQPLHVPMVKFSLEEAPTAAGGQPKAQVPGQIPMENAPAYSPPGPQVLAPQGTQPPSTPTQPTTSPKLSDSDLLKFILGDMPGSGVQPLQKAPARPPATPQLGSSPQVPGSERPGLTQGAQVPTTTEKPVVGAPDPSAGLSVANLDRMAATDPAVKVLDKAIADARSAGFPIDYINNLELKKEDARSKFFSEYGEKLKIVDLPGQLDRAKRLGEAQITLTTEQANEFAANASARRDAQGAQAALARARAAAIPEQLRIAKSKVTAMAAAKSGRGALDGLKAAEIRSRIAKNTQWLSDAKAAMSDIDKKEYDRQFDIYHKTSMNPITGEAKFAYTDSQRAAAFKRMGTLESKYANKYSAGAAQFDQQIAGMSASSTSPTVNVNIGGGAPGAESAPSAPVQRTKTRAEADAFLKNNGVSDPKKRKQILDTKGYK